MRTRVRMPLHLARVSAGMFAGLALGAACGGKVSDQPIDVEEPKIEICDSRLLFEGECPGVPVEPICGTSTCTQGIECAITLAATTSSELTGIAATAPPGSCIVLAPGRYDSVTLPASVSLLGSGARFVRVGGVRTGGGTVTVRGLEIGGTGLVVRGTGLATIDRVRVHGTDGRGIQATEASLVVRKSTIEETEAGAIEHVACGTAATTPPNTTLLGVRIRNTQGIAVRLCGVLADLRSVFVTDTRPKQFLFGRAIHIQSSLVLATATMVDQNSEAGIVLDRSGGRLGPDLIVMRSMPGVVIVEPNSDRVLLRGFDIRDNRAVSVSVQRAALGVTLEEGSITGTSVATFPSGVGGSFESGDGIDALSFSRITIAPSVHVTGSFRRAAVIDGTVVGSFAARLSGDDATLGIIVQTVDAPLAEGPAIALGIRVERRTSKDALPVLIAPPSP